MESEKGPDRISGWRVWNDETATYRIDLVRDEHGQTGTGATSRRGDAPLIRYLAETRGLATAQFWQRLPYVVLPGDGFQSYVQAHASELQAACPTLDRLPWPDFVCDCAPAVLDTIAWARVAEKRPDIADKLPQDTMDTRAQSWVRVTTKEAWLRGQAVASNWYSPGYVENVRKSLAFDPWICLEVWVRSLMTPDQCIPETYFISTRHPWDGGRGSQAIVRTPWVVDTPTFNIRAIVEQVARTATYTLVYLTQCNEYVVEVVPQLSEHQRKAADKATRKRPWLREDRPHYILIDPQRAHEYGARAADPVAPSIRPTTLEQAAATTPEHVSGSPRPHGRRGHWRQLQHERFKEPRAVWVAPAWVGPRDWTSAGQRYRVVAPASDLGTHEARA